MGTAFKLALVMVFGGAVIIGIVLGRNQAPPTAAAAPTATSTPIPVPLPNHINIAPSGQNNPPAFYEPATLTVHPGDQVTWTNRSSSPQTVTADKGAFDSGVLSPGESFSWTAQKPGRYTYSSYLSPSLRGEVDVTP